MNDKITPLRIALIFLFFFYFYPEKSYSENRDKKEQQLKKYFDNLLVNGGLWDKECQDRDAKVGVKIIYLDDGKTLYSLNEQTEFIPASNIKIITAAIALKLLSPAYRFKTEVYYHGLIDKGVLIGNLYMKGYGNPKLVTEELWLIVRDIKSRGILKVEGDIFIDDTFFDGERHNEWAKKLNSRAYSAKLGALSLNFNTIRVYVDPNSDTGNKPIISLDPPTAYLGVINNAVTTEKAQHSSLSVTTVNKNGTDNVLVEGEISIKSKRRFFYSAISDPPAYIGAVLKEFLINEGIPVSGEVKQGTIHENALLLLEHKSASLSSIVQDMNKFSNNFLAEQILKTLGAEMKGVQGTSEKGLEILRQGLKEWGYKDNEYTLKDGSGFSQLNRFSPSQFVKILRNVYNDFRIGPDFVSSLSLSGLDGSLKNRQMSSSMDNLVRAKTGTLDRASAISGFAGTDSGEKFVFSIIMNDFKCSTYKTWEIQSRLLEGLINIFSK